MESLETREIYALSDVLLHTFAGAAADGSSPLSQPTLVGNSLYLTTSSGGANGLGTIASINRDGTGYTVLHEFAGGATDGSQPQYGALEFDGTRLYGTTMAGGTSDLGVVFSYDTTQPPATAFSVLHSFTGGALDGSMPRGGLTIDGTTLYGVTTAGGGAFDEGVLFRIDTSGAGFEVLASFGFVLGDEPIGSPVLLDGHLYGTTTTGGLGTSGTIYDYDIANDTISVLHSFTAGVDDGGSPQNARLAVIGTSLFGITSNGGANNLGTVYRYDTTKPTSSAFSLLHSFAGGGLDGATPLGSLTVSGTQLFGTTSQGGTASSGTVFSYQTTTNSYSLRYSFDNSPTDGKSPVEGFAVVAEPGRVMLYGTTLEGGAPAGFGTIYSLQTPVADPNTISVTSADWQGKPQVTVYNADGTERFKFFAYKKSFLGGVRVAVGDVNADGTPDIITAPGPGRRQKIKVFSGVDLGLLAKFYAGSKSFSGGYYVAAGNFDADNRSEVVVAFGSGGTSAVQTFNIDVAGVTVLPGVLGLFYPFGSKFKGGVQVAAANIDGVGTDELIVAPGYNGGSVVNVYSSAGALVTSFVAYTSPYTGGLFVAAGDVNGDGLAEIVTGPAQTNLSLVQVFDGTTGTLLAQSNIDGNNFRGGTRVAVVDYNQDGIGDVMAAPGILGNQNIRILNGTDLSVIDSFFAGYPGPRRVRGVFVAGSRSY